MFPHTRAPTQSHTKLTQVVVEVFVHPRGPLMRPDLAKERMRVRCALRFPALMKLADASFELFPLAAEIALVGDH